jgi:hypothetical protein
MGHRTRRRVVVASVAVLAWATALARAPDTAAEAQWLPRPQEAALRLAVWNVDGAFFRNTAGFQQALRAIDADVLILDEMPGDTSAALIAEALPPGDAPWHVLYGTGGGPHQRASIAARRPLQRVAELDRLAYPPARFESWLSVVPPKWRAQARAALDAGVPAVGGVLELDGRRVLIGGVDLQCCGKDAAGPEEDRRRFESGAMRAALDRAAAGRTVDALLVGGDFNTVNGDAPVAIMQRGASAPTSLRIAHARHRGSDAIWTWDGRGTPYPSRQIDYALHSERLIVLQAQVFDTEDLSPESAQALQLDAGLSRSLSPHRPVVVDFRWR